MMRKPAKCSQELIVWQRAHQFVLEVYRFTSGYPRTEDYNLTSQFRRAAISVPANIAESFKKKGIADKLRYLNIVQGSLEECRYYLILSHDLGYGDTLEAMCKLDEVSKLLESYSVKVDLSKPKTVGS